MRNNQRVENCGYLLEIIEITVLLLSSVWWMRHKLEEKCPLENVDCVIEDTTLKEYKELLNTFWIY